MFNFMKRKANKCSAVNNMNIDATTISAREIGTDAYVKAIEGKLLPILVERNVFAKYGVDDIFADGARVRNDLTREDACYCMDVIEMVLGRIDYVSDAFNAKIDMVSEADAPEVCSADMLAQLCMESAKNVPIGHKERNGDRVTLINSVNTNLNYLPMMKDNAFKLIVIAATCAGYDMTGFSKG